MCFLVLLPWRFASLFTNPIAVSCSNWAWYLSSGGWLFAPLWADMLEICKIYHQTSRYIQTKQYDCTYPMKISSLAQEIIMLQQFVSNWIYKAVVTEEWSTYMHNTRHTSEQYFVFKKWNMHPICGHETNTYCLTWTHPRHDKL